MRLSMDRRDLLEELVRALARVSSAQQTLSDRREKSHQMRPGEYARLTTYVAERDIAQRREEVAEADLLREVRLLANVMAHMFHALGERPEDIDLLLYDAARPLILYKGVLMNPDEGVFAEIPELKEYTPATKRDWLEFMAYVTDRLQ